MRAYLHADRGSGYPLIYVPGIDGTGELLLGTAARLEESFRLVRLAYRAQGATAQDSYGELAASIADVCAGLGVERCLVLAESFGGAVAMQLALDHPQLVGGLMIVNSFAHYPHPVRLGISRACSGLIPRVVFDLGRRVLAPRSLFGGRANSKAVAEFRALPGTFFDKAYRRRMGMIQKLDLRPRLHELRQPMMLFAGDKDRIVPSVGTLGAVAALVPQATFEVVSGGGHLILPLAEEPWVQRLLRLQAKIPKST